MEYKRCVCKGSACEWQLKGNKCEVESKNDLDAFFTNEISAIREMHLTNAGVVNVSFKM